MHKRVVRFGLVTGVLVGLLCLLLPFGKSGAATAPDLISAAQLDVLKSAEVPAVPISLNGNVDCIPDGSNSCVIDTSYGKFSSSGSVKLNRTSNYYPLISYVDNKTHSIAIPNSNTIINYTTEPPYGFYLYFTKNFAPSITQTIIYGTNIKQYQINRLYDGKLVDKTNHRLAADYGSMSFSANGQWMVVSMPNVAMLRVNLETFEVVPFAAGFNYTIGLDPGLKTAITNDGRYVTVASKAFTRFAVYDLNTCGSVPNTINGPVVCQSRNLQTVMQQKMPGYISVGQVRFVNDTALKLYADYNDGGGHKIAPFTIYPSGQGAHQHDYLALGDSYISGEGAYNYLEGTDTGDNECHVSLVAYPFLLAHDLNYNTFHSVACSGAKIEDVIDTSGDYKGQSEPKTKKHDRTNDEIKNILTNFQVGYIDQLDFVTTYQPQVITLSVGGNDIGFSNILASCVSPLNLATCYSAYEDRLELVRQINAQFTNLVSTYQTLKNSSPPDTRIYVVGYPQIVKPGGNCGFNVQLNADELVFAQQFTSYLDSVIQQAAAKAGVFYTDTQNAFNGHRLCEAGLGKFAVNGLTKGGNFPKLLGGFIHGPLGNESYHPTPLGYSLLRDSVATTTNRLGAAMPAPNPSAAPPAETGLDILNVPHLGRAVNATSYENGLSGDILTRGTLSDIFVSGLESSLKPLASYRVELHSTPVVLGSFSSSSGGDLSSQVTIPSTVPTGFHSLHIYGTNIANEPVDIYKTVYVAASGDDYNGNGIPNTVDPCVFVDASGQDYDQDGTDDACDGNITDPPPPPPPAPIIEPVDPTLEQPIDQPLLQSSVQPISSLPETSSQNLQPPVEIPDTPQTTLTLATNVQVTQSHNSDTQPQDNNPSLNSANNLILATNDYPAASTTPAIDITPTPKVLAAQTTQQSDPKKHGEFLMIIAIISLVAFTGLVTWKSLKSRS